MKNMKKIIITWALLVLLTSCGAETEGTENKTETPETTNVVETNVDRDAEIIALQPDYKVELYGKVKSIEWNIFTVSEIDRSKDPTIEMEKEEKQAYMASLSDADKIALKEQMGSAFLWDIKVMIPVWIPMVKKELVWEERLDLEATLEDLKTGDIISIWYNEEVTDRKIAKYVKRSMRK